MSDAIRAALVWLRERGPFDAREVAADAEAELKELEWLKATHQAMFERWDEITRQNAERDRADAELLEAWEKLDAMEYSCMPPRFCGALERWAAAKGGGK